MMDAATFEREFGPEPVFDEPAPPAHAPAYVHDAYANVKASFDIMHARWLELRAKWVWPN